MSDLWSTAIGAAVSVLTALFSSAALSQTARLRKEVSELAVAVGASPQESSAYRSLTRSLEITSARFTAIKLVPISVGLIFSALSFIVLGVVVMVTSVGQVGVWMGLISIVTGYVIGIFYTSSVSRLRDRQFRAIMAGSPSGFARLDPSMTGRSVYIRDRFRPVPHFLSHFNFWRSRRVRNTSAGPVGQTPASGT